MYTKATNNDGTTAHSEIVLALSIIKGICTLAAMWGFTLQFKFLVEADVFTERFALKGKRWTITFTMIINGILPFVFTIFPIALQCKPPFGFTSRSKVFECFLYQPLLMMTQWLGVKSYCQDETIKHCCINNEDHKETSTCTTYKFRKQRNNGKATRSGSRMSDKSKIVEMKPGVVSNEPVTLSPTAPVSIDFPTGFTNNAYRRRSAISVTDLATINEQKKHENEEIDNDF